MPTGAVSLIEATQCGGDMHKQGVVETIIQENPVIEMLPWMPFAGNALKHDEEGTLPKVQFRRVNEGYDSSYGSDNQHTWGVAILGGEIKVDRYLVDVVGSEKDIEAKQWAKLAKANSMRFGWEFFHGTGSVASKGFAGLNALIDEGFGQKFANSTTGAVIDLDKLDESLDLFKNQGQPDRALVNRVHRRQVTKAARTSVSGISLIDVGTDVFGKKVMSYDGIPFTLMGEVMNSSGQIVPTLDFNEDPGDGTSDTSSIYFIKFGEDDVTGLLGKGGTFNVTQFGELEALPQRMGRLEWYPGVAVFNKYAVVRVTGITKS